MTFFLDDDQPSEKWTLAQIYADLGSRSMVIKALDVHPQRMHKWLLRRERIKCPYPLVRLGRTDVYSITEWRAWFARWEEHLRRKTENNKWVDAQTGATGQPFFTYREES